MTMASYSSGVILALAKYILLLLGTAHWLLSRKPN